MFNFGTKTATTTKKAGKGANNADNAKKKPGMQFGTIKKAVASQAKPQAKSGTLGGFKFGGGAKKSAAPTAMKSVQKKPGGGVLGMFGGTQKSDAPTGTVKKDIKKLTKSYKAASAKPAVTFSSKKSMAKPVRKTSTGGPVTADTRRTGARKNPRDVKADLAKWYGPNRALYLPPGLLPYEDVPKYLDGTIAGDYGFDPLGLSKTKEDVAKLREAELIHARWAMLAVPGVFFPEALGVKGGTWFETGKVALEGNLGYTAPPLFSIENPLPLPVVVLVQIGLMGLVEKYRRDGEGPTKGWAPIFGAWEDQDVFKGLDKLSPGGPLNPFGAATSSPDEMKLMKEREIKNGRIAMIAMLGVFVQALVTGEGPYANWSKHVSDPFGYNLTTIFSEQVTL